MTTRSSQPSAISNLPFWMLAAFLAVLWIAGGASRSDVSGQVVVRFTSWAMILVAIVALPRIDWRAIRSQAIILGLIALVVAIQLVPLPPELWSALPGRQLLLNAASLINTEQPWRPASMSPSGTINALSSLVVPATVLLLAANLNMEHHWRIARMLLWLALACAVIGLVQFSGTELRSPFVNSMQGAVSGTFANRNHFSLFMAISCVLGLIIAIRDHSRTKGLGPSVFMNYWRLLVSFALIGFLTMIILATGSRAGLALSLLAIGIGILCVRRELIGQIRAMPVKWILAMAGMLLLFAIMLGLSISLDKAVSLDRAANLDGETELRQQIWPVVFDMARQYFPAGSGFGTFDPVFRISEPEHILNRHYINQAHNDWLQIVLEGGACTVPLLIGSLLWFGYHTQKAWGGLGQQRNLLAQTGTIVLVLIMLASVPDYPARTPMIMALVALASVWITKWSQPSFGERGSG